MALVGTGLVHVTGSQRMLNGLFLNGLLADNLKAGQLVRVSGNLSAALDSL
jgi:hypothetical protein